MLPPCLGPVCLPHLELQRVGVALEPLTLVGKIHLPTEGTWEAREGGPAVLLRGPLTSPLKSREHLAPVPARQPWGHPSGHRLPRPGTRKARALEALPASGQAPQGAEPATPEDLLYFSRADHVPPLLAATRLVTPVPVLRVLSAAPAERVRRKGLQHNPSHHP